MTFPSSLTDPLPFSLPYSTYYVLFLTCFYYFPIPFSSDQWVTDDVSKNLYFFWCRHYCCLGLLFWVEFYIKVSRMSCIFWLLPPCYCVFLVKITSPNAILLLFVIWFLTSHVRLLSLVISPHRWRYQSVLCSSCLVVFCCSREIYILLVFCSVRGYAHVMFGEIKWKRYSDVRRWSSFYATTNVLST